MSRQRLYRFDTLPAPFALPDEDAFIDAVAGRLHGWRVAPWRGPAPAPFAAIEGADGRYRLHARRRAAPLACDGTAAAVCAAMAELALAHAEARPDRLLLHAGSVAIGGRLMAFPAPGRAGKSTLAAQLACRGGRVFSDDLLALDLASGQAVALGIAPRVRLPLPDGFAPETRAWIGRHRGLDAPDGTYSYLALPRAGPGALAPLGATLPVAAFVALERADGAAPHMAPCPRSEIMRLLVVQHFRTAAPTADAVARLADAVGRAACYRLRHGGGEAAADLLTRMAAAA